MNRRPAFTLIELLVVISIVTLLISILLPVLRQARAAAQDVTCLTQLAGMSKGWNAVVTDRNGRFPNTQTAGAADKWDTQILAAMGFRPDDPGFDFGCPVVINRYGPNFALAGRTTYGVNVRWSPNGPPGENEQRRDSDLLRPSEYPLIGDTYVNQAFNPSFPLIYDEIGERIDQDWRVGFHHTGATANIAYADGHAEAHTRKIIQGPTDDNGVPLYFFNAAPYVGNLALATPTLRPR